MKTKHLLPLKDAYALGVQQGLGNEIADISALEREEADHDTSRTRRRHVARLFREKGLLSLFLEAYWPEGERYVKKYLA